LISAFYIHHLTIIWLSIEISNCRSESIVLN
jgi:hypothetical protein